MVYCEIELLEQVKFNTILFDLKIVSSSYFAILLCEESVARSGAIFTASCPTNPMYIILNLRWKVKVNDKLDIRDILR